MGVFWWWSQKALHRCIQPTPRSRKSSAKSGRPRAEGPVSSAWSRKMTTRTRYGQLFSSFTTQKPRLAAGLSFYLGNVLLSHTLARAVPSGLKGLTSVFGMGTGGSPSLQSPKSQGPAASSQGPVKAPAENRRPALNIDGLPQTCVSRWTLVPGAWPQLFAGLWRLAPGPSLYAYSKILWSSRTG